MASKKTEIAAPNPVKDEHDYEADDALRTLERAHEVKENKELMKRVHKKAGRKVAALSGLFAKPAEKAVKRPKNIEELKQMRNEMAMEKDE